MYQTGDICAIASGGVQSAIAIVRISGHQIIAKLNTNIVFHRTHLSLNTCKANVIYRADFVCGGHLIDDIMLIVYKAPKSYTGEDMVEIFSHGSLFIQQEILKCLQIHNIRLAEPGEFSLRAYLNGKMDLTQAEALNDIISSKNALSHSIAINQLKGGITNEIKNIRSLLLQLLSLVELELDFSEEDVEFASRDKIVNLLTDLIFRIEKLSVSFDYGNALKSGVSVAIVGNTNVGKSTLMNALLNEEKSIVSHIPGTTRDVIEDSFYFKGITFRFADTAGIRNSVDVIEKIGIERAQKKASEAKIILLIVNGEDVIENTKKNIQQWKQSLTTSQEMLVLLNKIDKISKDDLNYKLSAMNEFGIQMLPISAKLKTNINELLNKMVEYVQSLHVAGTENIITNIRHYNALRLAIEASYKAKEAIENNLPNDLLAEELKMVNNHLSQLIGEIPSPEILNEIFSNFCIGK